MEETCPYLVTIMRTFLKGGQRTPPSAQEEVEDRSVNGTNDGSISTTEEDQDAAVMDLDMNLGKRNTRQNGKDYKERLEKDQGYYY